MCLILAIKIKQFYVIQQGFGDYLLSSKPQLKHGRRRVAYLIEIHGIKEDF